MITKLYPEQILSEARLRVVGDAIAQGKELSDYPAWQVLYRAERYLEDAGTHWQTDDYGAIAIGRRTKGKAAMRIQYPNLKARVKRAN